MNNGERFKQTLNFDNLNLKILAIYLFFFKTLKITI